VSINLARLTKLQYVTIDMCPLILPG